MAYLDNYQPQIDERILTVGFPTIFNPNWIGEKTLVAGTLHQIVRTGPPWTTDNVVSEGGSGSPAVIPGPDNQPLVVGLVSGYRLVAAETSPYPPLIIPLQIQTLLNSGQ